MTLTEDRLADLLRGIADGVEPPARGPERVLAAAAAGRPSAPGSGRRTRGVALAAMVAAVVLVLGLVAFINGGSTAGPAHVSGFASASATTVASAGPELGAASAAQGVTAAMAAPATTAGPGMAAAPGAPVVATAAAKVVKTGSLTLQVSAGHVTSSVDTLATTAAGLGGYVASTATTNAGGATADVTLRVPSAQFEALLAHAQALGTTMSVSTSGQDVTGQFVDLNARINALEASRQRYLDILTHATTVGDILAVQQQLDGLQTQLEELQGQLNVLTDQTSYGTLTVHVQEPGSAPPHHTTPSGLSAAWQRARRGFTRGAESVIGASGGVAVFLACVALLAVVARVGWGLARRRLV
jgi:hypothetical protein